MNSTIARWVGPALLGVTLGWVAASARPADPAPAGAAAPATAPATAPASAAPQTLPLGVWGAQGVASLALTASGGTVRLPCAEGELNGPLTPDGDHYRADGTLGRQQSVRIAYAPAHFQAALHGATLTLTVTDAAGGSLGVYTLTHGALAFPPVCY
jgi:hypothetical protein